MNDFISRRCFLQGSAIALDALCASGLSALLGVLISCASGVTVVNIDNGFGAACAACKINNLCQNQG